MSNPSFYKQSTQPDLTSPLKTPPLPAQIGPYKIESLLSKGGMSLLYLGLHPETKQPLAIKVLSPEYVIHQELVDHFLKEAHIIGISNHPNIVKLYGEGKWENGLYIAMEFIHGVSLRQFITQQSLSLRRTLDIVLQVAYALLHLHTHGVIHRDLKPENILITEDGEIKVIDFGIAQLHEEVPSPKIAGRVLGTPNYMSPEQKENASKATFASDIYSLGVIAYELVTGKLSYGMIDLSLLPRSLRKIISKTLAISVRERYQDIVDFISDLSQYLKSDDIEKDRPGTDQIKEIHETLQMASQTLCPVQLPDWPDCDLGVAKIKGPSQLGLYYDFFTLPQGQHLVILAHPEHTGLETSLYAGILRGMIRMRLQEPNFSLTTFLPILNRLLCEDPMRQEFNVQFLLLEPATDQLTFIACGANDMYHLPQGSTSARKLIAPNTALGHAPTASFAVTTDNWKSGDMLFLHTLHPKEASRVDLQELDLAFNAAIAENALLSAQRQSDAILRKLAATVAYTKHKQPKALICVQRIA